MPELPEVQTTVSGLLRLTGCKIKKTLVYNRSLRWPIIKNIETCLENQTIINISRRAKYIIVQLDVFHLVIHLGMTGKFTFSEKNIPLKKHDHVEFFFEGTDEILRYNDPRRFGSIHLLKKQDSLDDFFLFKKLGPEPLSEEFNHEYFYNKAKSHKQSVKAFVMNSSVVVGVGNIYASEALFMSKILPSKAANQLSKKKMITLVDCIKKVLELAIEKGGSSINDYFNTNGQSGYFQIELSVYGRENLPCNICKTLIKKITIGQRSSFFCSVCQR